MGYSIKSINLEGHIDGIQEEIEVMPYAGVVQYVNLIVKGQSGTDYILKIPRGKIGEIYIEDLILSFEKGEQLLFTGVLKETYYKNIYPLLWFTPRLVKREYTGKIHNKNKVYRIKYSEKVTDGLNGGEKSIYTEFRIEDI